MSLANTSWRMDLTQEGVEESLMRFHFNVETHNTTTGRIVGRLARADGSATTVAVPLRKAKGRIVQNNPEIIQLSFLVNLGGLAAFVTGVVTPVPMSTNRAFNGTYTGASFDDPGDTGTATGTQTT